MVPPINSARVQHQGYNYLILAPSRGPRLSDHRIIAPNIRKTFVFSGKEKEDQAAPEFAPVPPFPVLLGQDRPVPTGQGRDDALGLNALALEPNLSLSAKEGPDFREWSSPNAWTQRLFGRCRDEVLALSGRPSWRCRDALPVLLDEVPVLSEQDEVRRQNEPTEIDDRDSCRDVQLRMSLRNARTLNAMSLDPSKGLLSLSSTAEEEPDEVQIVTQQSLMEPPPGLHVDAPDTHRVQPVLPVCSSAQLQNIVGLVSVGVFSGGTFGRHFHGVPDRAKRYYQASPCSSISVSVRGDTTRYTNSIFHFGSRRYYTIHGVHLRFQFEEILHDTRSPSSISVRGDTIRRLLIPESL